MEFYAYSKPSLASGNYYIKVSQKISNPQDANKEKGIDQKVENIQNFRVCSEQTKFLPSLIHSVFPPIDSHIEQSCHSLPHIGLNRCSLPWERNPTSISQQSNTPRSWLALLVFTEGELNKSALKVCDLQDLKKNIIWPYGNLEIEASDNEKITALDIPYSVLSKIIPSFEDLLFNAHVREYIEEENNLSISLSTIIANRLPEPGKLHYAYLVSLENCYYKKNDKYEFAEQSIASAQIVRLICLYQWQFTCPVLSEESLKNYDDIILNLQNNADIFRLKSNIQLDVLSKSYIPLNHQLRNGNKTVSFYRGPLLACNTEIHGSMLPAKDADSLMIYDEKNGMFNATYAAAWQIGRLLTLENTTVANALLLWKNRQMQNAVANQMPNLLQQKFKGFHSFNLLLKLSSEPIPSIVTEWFNQLKTLEHIPINYLIPHEQLLPVESIRFFKIDTFWLDCLIDGGLSIGRTIENNTRQDRKLLASTGTCRLANNRVLGTHQFAIPKNGFLLRSRLVSGWKKLTIYNCKDISGENKQRPLIVRKLTPNILLVLFDEELANVIIHLPEESLFLGFNGERNNYHKNLSYNRVKIELKNEEIKWQTQLPGMYTLSLSGLANTIQSKFTNFTIDSANFAHQMLVGTNTIQFHLSKLREN